MNVLRGKYNDILAKYGIGKLINKNKSGAIGSHIISSFMKSHKNVAFYGYDNSIRILISDFIFELKAVKHIIENTMASESTGYEVILEENIANHDIDGVIIGGDFEKDEIIQRLKRYRPNLGILRISDVYQNTDRKVVITPYYYYAWINELQRKIESSQSINSQDFIALIIKYIEIKDFYSAAKYSRKLYRYNKDANIGMLADDLEKLYELMLNVAKKISSSNVVLVCVDGLMRENLPSLNMPKLSTLVYQRGYRFTNAYSFSSSTFESLIPVYSENGDLRTKYYEGKTVPGGCCRFINEANRQNRKIFFYSSDSKFIEDESIEHRLYLATLTEKIWDFLTDAIEVDNGLFYMHVLYESHFSFPNPYTEEAMIFSGTAMIFDYLESLGGKLRADYKKHNKDALRYIDDMLSPILDALSCRILIYADHGNKIYSQDQKLEEIKHLNWSAGESLFRIPLTIISPEMGTGENKSLISLMEIHDIVIALLNQRKYEYTGQPFIKIARSEIYNPDLRFLCKKASAEHELLAFEGFIFEAGYKLIVYADGVVSLFHKDSDREILDITLRKFLFSIIMEDLTVCEKALCFEYLTSI